MSIPDIGFINIFGVCLHYIELDTVVLESELAVFHSKLHAKKRVTLINEKNYTTITDETWN